jgi:hypothetical protein
LVWGEILALEGVSKRYAFKWGEEGSVKIIHQLLIPLHPPPKKTVSKYLSRNIGKCLEPFSTIVWKTPEMLLKTSYQ